MDYGGFDHGNEHDALEEFRAIAAAVEFVIHRRDGGSEVMNMRDYSDDPCHRGLVSQFHVHALSLFLHDP